MALPFVVLASLIGSAVHISYNRHYKNVERERYLSTGNRESISTVKKPSDYYDKSKSVSPRPGSVVCCELYGVLDHTGIWIDSDTIVELSSTGLIRAISVDRFIENRSGSHVFVACNNKHLPITVDGTIDRALQQVFTYRDYDVINNNCHRFVHYCLTGNNKEITRFGTLSDTLAEMSGENIYWDKAAI